MTTVELERRSVAASNDNGTTTAIDFPEAFGDKHTLKRALSELQRGPIRRPWPIAGVGLGHFV